MTSSCKFDSKGNIVIGVTEKRVLTSAMKPVEYEYLSNGAAKKKSWSIVFDRQTSGSYTYVECRMTGIVENVVAIKPKVNNCMSTLKNSLKDIQECRNKCVLNKYVHLIQ